MYSYSQRMLADAPLIRVLGPVGIRGPEGMVPIGGSLPRGFVAVLALEVGHTVGLDRMSERLWGEHPPDGVKAAVQQTATRARRALASCGLGGALRATAPGYVLDLDEDSVDLFRFRRLAKATRGASSDEAIRLTAEALALWEGRALADLVDLPLSRHLSEFLDDERWRVEEQRASALLAAGRPDEAAAGLASATSQEPLREQLWVLYARALRDAGRTTEAVRAVRAATDVLAAELGLAPGAELAELGRQLNRNRAAVRGTAAAVSPETAQFGLADQARRRAFDAAELSARDAHTRHAHIDAVHHGLRALDLLSLNESDDDRRQRVLIVLGEAYNQSGNEASARAVCLEAVAIARRRADATGLGWAVLGYCADRIGFSPPPEQAELLEEALGSVPSDDHLLRSRLLGRLARELYWVVSADRCRELAEEATAEALLANDTESRLLARYSLAFGNWTPARTHQLVEVSEEYLSDAVASGDRLHELLARRWLVPAVTELGDVARGAREAALAMALADELGMSSQQWVVRVIAGAHDLVVGDIAGAERMAEEAMAIGAVPDPGPSLDYASLLLWTIRWLQGRLEEIAPLVEEVANGKGIDLQRRLGLALTRGALGRVDEAREILDAVDEQDVDGMPLDASWYAAMAALAEAAALTSHDRSARLAWDRLLPYRERIAITTTTATGPIAHQLGLSARVLGDHSGAAAAFGEAIAVADRCGAPAFAARSRLELAACRAFDGATDDARLLAAEALEVATRLGMVGTAAAARDLLSQVTSRASP